MSHAFLNRFHSVWQRKRRVQIGRVVTATLLLAIAGWGCIAAADYAWELDRSTRILALGAALSATLVFGAISLRRSMSRWGRPFTAAEIEQAFPELGQSVRTTVQFGSMPAEQVASEGVVATLITALSDQTYLRALPLTIEDVIPARRLWRQCAAVAAGLIALCGISWFDWEWRYATQRALLAEHVYRELEVLPGDQTIAEGDNILIQAKVTGRTNREVALFTRPAGQANAEWTRHDLQTLDGLEDEAAPPPPNITARQHVTYSSQLDRLMKPIEYRIALGELSSSTFRVDVRSPLRISEFKIDLTPPAYTGQPTRHEFDPDFSGLQGTRVRIQIEFDKPVKSAMLVFASAKRPTADDEPAEPEVVPLAITANLAVAERTLTESSRYIVQAEALDGTVLEQKKYRIRVRQDQPPQVSFEEPEENLEVHSLAELPMRIRVGDDYGLSKAGVVFQVNNEQQIPLISKDFETVASAAREVAATGAISPTTQSLLEKVLPLEVFDLTQKDSVMYFAFAEDNRPESAQRSETEMRFIDIRPFKRTYRVFDPDPGTGIGGRDQKTLQELIQLQRSGLRRTMQIEKRAAMGQMPSASTLAELMQSETDLAKHVREFAEGLERMGFSDTDLLHNAEISMLAAVDSLSVAKWETAVLQMKDALKALIEQRQRADVAIFKNPDPALLARLRQFDRLQAQKIRRPKSDKEEARDLIRRLQQLVSEEGAVVTGLTDDEPPTEQKAPEVKSSEPNPPQP